MIVQHLKANSNIWQRIVFRIRNEQEEAMAEGVMRRFTEASVPFLLKEAPDWCVERSEEELGDFVASIIAFADEYHIRKAVNIRSLMMLKIEQDFEMPLTGFLHAKTKRKAFDEDYRLEYLAQFLMTGRRPTLITLDTDLEALRQRNDG